MDATAKTRAKVAESSQPGLLIGRGADLEALGQLLSTASARMITITGPGGVGKTCLALATALHVQHEFPDGARLIRLDAVRHPDQVLVAIAASLAIPVITGNWTDAIAETLQDQHRLILLDNFEHLLEAGPQLAQIVDRCPGVRWLVTSRERLRLSMEYEFPLQPLALPEREAVTCDQIAQSPAVMLLSERMIASNPAFRLTAENAPAVAAICQRLDGLPLALELVASHAAFLSPSIILPLLAQSLPMLTGGPRDAPSRLQTMANAIAWSVDRLDKNQAKLFRTLSILPGSFPLETAQFLAIHTGASSNPSEFAVQLLSLRDKHLIRQETEVAIPARFRMLEVVRAYGLGLQTDGDEYDDAMRLLTNWLAEEAIAFSVLPVGTAAEATAILRWEREYPLLQMVFDWWLVHGPARSMLNSLVNLGRLWRMRSHFADAQRWLNTALNQLEPDNQPVQAYLVSGILARDKGDYRLAIEQYEIALAMANTTGHLESASYALNSLGSLKTDQGLLDEGERLTLAALAIQQSTGDNSGLARSLHNLGWVAIERGNRDEAIDYLHESLRIWQEMDDLDSAARAEHSLAALAFLEQRYEYATAGFDRSVTIWRDLGLPGHLAEAMVDQAAAELMLGKTERAAILVSEALSIYLRIGVRFRTPEALEAAAAIATVTDHLNSARRWFAYSDGLRLLFGMQPACTWKQALAGWKVAAGSGDTAFLGSLNDRSNSQTLDDALSLLHQLVASSSKASNPRTQLTMREREVLKQIVTGQSDQEIADMLFISRRTASKHVSAILEKLKAPTRAAAAAIAVRDGLS